MDDSRLDSQIDAVTVFSRGAQVVRLAPLPLGEKPPTSLRVGGLPLTLEDSSIRACVEGGAATSRAGLHSVSDVRVDLEVPEEAGGEDAPEVEELRRARLAVEQQEVRLGHLERELARLHELKPPRRRRSAKRPPAGDPTVARLALISFCAERGERLSQRLAVARQELEDLRRRRQQAEDRLRRASSDQRLGAHTLRKSVVVRLRHGDTRSDEPLRLRLEYLVPGARWAPAYVVRTESSGKALLQLKAHVSQNSGEDWNGVRLTLATADPQRWAELPELQSLRIGRRQPTAPPTGWRLPPDGSRELFGDWERAFKLGRSALPSPPPTPDEAELEEMLCADLSEELALEAESEPASEELEAGALLEEDVPPAAPAVAMAAAPAPGLMMRAKRNVNVRAPRGTQPSPASVKARDELLDYANLCMPPAHSEDRGRLVMVRHEQRYLHLTLKQRVDVLHVLDDARRHAASAGDRPPPRCHLAGCEAGFDYAWPAEGRVDVSSDRHYHLVPLLEREAQVQLRHVSVPRETPDVFRVAVLTNPFPAPLLRGPADVYLDGEFLVRADLASTPAEGRLELGLGVEPAIKVARNTRYREETRGLTGGRLALEHTIELQVANRLARSIRLEVRERVPVAPGEGDDIEVEVHDVEPRWESWEPALAKDRDALRGGHRWRLDLAAGTEQMLRVGYRVRISAKHELVGGNRRES